MLAHLIEGFSLAFTLTNIFWMLVGTILGMIFASIPGLTFSTALVIMIPFTFGMDNVSAIAVLIGIFSGGMSGGAISAVLLGIPGTPSAAATVLDGYPMAQKGQAPKALGMAVVASVFGGIFSLIVLMLVAEPVARVALKIGNAEQFALVVFGMSIIVSLSESSMAKGLLAGFAGILVTTIGLDPVMAFQRYTFGITALQSGIDIMPVMIGAFAMPEVIETFWRVRTGRPTGEVKLAEGEKVRTAFPSLKEMKECMRTLIVSSAIGTGIGAIPGTGGPISCFIAYDRAKKRNPEVGTGVMEGIAAPEAANNAVTGGAMIPLLTLGIPGDSSTAIMLGAFMIHGLAPGPLLFQNNGGLVYAIYISMVIVYLLVLILQFYGIKLFVKVLDIPRIYLMMFILLMVIVGSFAVHLNYVDIIIAFIFGVIGYFMKRFGIPTTPLILGIVLGGIIEKNFRKALVISKGSYLTFVTRPVSLLFLVLAVIMIVRPAISAARKRSKAAAES